MTYIKRIIETSILDYLKAFPVVGLTGARQTGKSTTLKKILPNYRYITFDDYRILDFFSSDPEGFFKLYDDKVIFDEVQKAPKIFNYIKISVDNDRSNYGKFVLTSTVQFSFMQNISESLAGRIGLLKMTPFCFEEIPESQKDESLHGGCYPELISRNYYQSQNWYASYTETYLQKDVRLLLNITDLRDFQNLMILLASNVGGILNMSNLAIKIGVSVPTIKRWISILEASFIIFLLPAYYKNFGVRIRKLPKIYFFDSGLVSHLLGIKNLEDFKASHLYGNLFENYVVSQIYKKEFAHNTKAESYYFRSSNSEEIDLIITRGEKREFLEIKAGQSFKTGMCAAMEKYMEENDQGYLLYNGEKFAYKEKVKVINFQDYLLT